MFFLSIALSAIPDRRCNEHFGLTMTKFTTFENFLVGIHMLEAPLIMHASYRHFSIYMLSYLLRMVTVTTLPNCPLASTQLLRA